MTIRALTFAAVLMLAAPAMADEPQGARALCANMVVEEASYVVCRFDAAADAIQLFHAGADGEAFGHFSALKTALEARGDLLLFAMNAGMYDEARAPVGLYVENGAELKKANTNPGPGNFHLKPNGVFFIDQARTGVMETGKFLESGIAPRYATQSGPMLVVDDAIHPAFRVDSTSKKRRNGVGVSADGRIVTFAISDSVVTFYEFASLFRDVLDAPNALFLDGGVSRLYAPELGRNDAGPAMGPIVGVTVHVD